MAKIRLAIKHEGEKHGYRMIDQDKTGSDRFKNPNVHSKDTVTWQAPKGKDAFIVFLEDSPFLLNGVALKNTVMQIRAGATSNPVTISDEPTGESEYGAMVRDKQGDYVYVRGEMSPPGVIVGR